MPDKCLFCGIVNGEVPAKVVAEDESCIAFRDIGPKAPTHVLVIPRQHLDSLNQVEDIAIVAKMAALALRVAKQEAIDGPGYRLVINTNAHGGQTVHHLHMHLLGGRQMKWPPG
ncbi:MAG: histidine triad nucleotide-binding protein [Gemmatimonadales bacterium]